jgi:hypothetical protein
LVCRKFCLTGTIGASLASESHDIDDDCWKSPLFNKCIDSWFGRHKSTDEMQQGSANKQFLFQCIKTNDWVNDIFEVGMLQALQGGPWLAVSPDAIVLGTIQYSDDKL